MRGKQVLAMLVVSAVLLLAVGCGGGGSGGGAAAIKTQLALGAVNKESGFYAMHVATAGVLNENGFNAKVVETGGGVDNIQRLSRNEVDAGYTTMDTIFTAYQGQNQWKEKPYKDIRVLFITNVAPLAMAVRADSGINTVANLAGKAFNPGAQGSSTANAVSRALNAIGVKADLKTASVGDAVNAIKDKRMVGFTKATPGLAPDSSIVELGTTVPLKFLSFTPEQEKKIQAAVPEISFINFPAGIINKDQPAMRILALYSTWSVSTALNGETVEAMLKAVYGKFDEKILPAYKAAFRPDDITKYTVANSLVPLHKGAAKFFKEKGAKIPDALIPPEAK